MRNNVLLLRESAAHLEIRKAVPRPSTFDPQARTVEAVIASAAPVVRQDARGAFHEILDVRGLDVEASKGASVLDSHNQGGGIGAIIGTLDEVRVEGDEVIGLIRFSSHFERIDDVRDGILSSLSVGYQVDEWADGQIGGTRTKTATRWVIREASFVSVPADSRARTRAFDDRVTRARSIRQLGRQAGAPTDMIDDLIDGGASLEEARARMWTNLVTRGRMDIRTSATGYDNPEFTREAMADAILCRMYPGRTPSAQARPYTGFTLAELAKECLHRAGVSVMGASPVSLIERSSYHSTSDFAAVMANVMNKSLRVQYDNATSAIKQLARQSTANDFRVKHAIMLDSSGLVLQPTTENGEFRYGTMVDAEETYAISTLGLILAFTRQAAINDDLGALTTITTKLGQAAAATEAKTLVDVLTANSGLGPTMKDGAKLFTSSHANVATPGAAPSEATLTAAKLAMRRQTGPSGGLIIVEPRFVLVPPELEVATQKLLTSIQPVQVADVNPFSNLTLVVEPRLTDAFRWYLVADPAQVEGLEYSYLAGAAGPQTETRSGWEIDGFEVKVRLDFGAGFIDSRSWFMNPGH